MEVLREYPQILGDIPVTARLLESASSRSLTGRYMDSTEEATKDDIFCFITGQFRLKDSTYVFRVFRVLLACESSYGAVFSAAQGTESC